MDTEKVMPEGSMERAWRGAFDSLVAMRQGTRKIHDKAKDTIAAIDMIINGRLTGNTADEGVLLVQCKKMLMEIVADTEPMAREKGW